jgi:hypothetical protein
MIDEASQKRRSLTPIVDKMLSSSRNTGSESGLVRSCYETGHL